eukprot:5539987-Prymnesium_polylepis.2
MDGGGPGRLTVELVSFKGAWCCRQVGKSSDSDVYFVRKSSMREKSQWPALKPGSYVSLTIRSVAGRGVVSDAVLVTDAHQ